MDLRLKFCVQFNFSSSFPLPHLSHCHSVHHPPSFSEKCKSCSSSLSTFVHPPATPSLFTTNISLNTCSSTIFMFLLLRNTNKITQHRTHLNLYNRYSLFIIITYWYLCYFYKYLYTIWGVLNNYLDRKVYCALVCHVAYFVRPYFASRFSKNVNGWPWTYFNRHKYI